MRAVFNLTLAGSTDATTDVVLDPAEVAAVSGESLEDVNAVLDKLIEGGAADRV